MAKKTECKVKSVPRSVSNNTQESRTILPSQVHSPPLAWLYHSNWHDNLFPPHIIPPFLPGHQPLLNLGHLGTKTSRTEVPLVVPEMPSPDIPSRESRSSGFGRGRGRGMWSPPGNSNPNGWMWVTFWSRTLLHE